MVARDSETSRQGNSNGERNETSRPSREGKKAKYVCYRSSAILRNAFQIDPK